MKEKKTKKKKRKPHFNYIFFLLSHTAPTLPPCLPVNQVCELAYELEQCGVDIINTGIGWHEARVPTIATSVPRAAFTWVTRKLKEDCPDLSTPLCTTNRINMPNTVEQVREWIVRVNEWMVGD